ncbi:MAG: SpoIIE family protein phosphatase [Methanoregula sp.]|jgi:sigma-B regulation protein RsbU (phosphoserine phosphatase)|nr:SpoIIE family protein phosphatase [Methanoregula sp.]
MPSLNMRTKILMVFLALSIVSLLITGFAAFYTISEMGSSAQESSTELGKEAVRNSSAALEKATEDYMVRVAVGQAGLIDEIFWSTESELDILAAQARSVQNNPAYESQIRSYPITNPPQDPMMGTVVLLAPDATVTETDPEYHALAGMDDLLAAVYRTDGDLTAVYVVTESGIMRSYPGDGEIVRDFDPRTRSWYKDAVLSNGPVWTEPYIDASGQGWILTCARSVKTRYGTWVVASDVTTGQLNEYTNLTLGGKGYAILMDDKGTILNRQGIVTGDPRANQDARVDNVFLNPDPDIVAIGYNMTGGMTGLGRATFDGVETIIAYAPVNTLNWSYAISMPVSDVLEPIRKTESNILVATFKTSAQILQFKDRLLYIFAGLCVLLLAIVIILSWYLARIITRPVDALREGTAVIGHGNLDFRLDIRSGDEFEALGNSFNQMASDLQENIENLKRTTAEKERFTKELEIAKEIQDSFLPESIPAIVGFDVAAVTIPALEIGGDLYDFIPTGKDCWGFTIADVSGKGVSAALYMALSRTILHACGEADADPSAAVRNANRLISDDSRSSMFITVFYGVLNPQAMTFTYVNAGHNPPLFIREGVEGGWITGPKGIALGVVPVVDIASTLLEIRHGDLLVLYTDGVTEAFNEKDEYFGEERLMDCISRHRSRPAKEIMDTLLEEIRAFSGAAPQSDDITLVVIRVL